jgi:hypothetical protein
MSDPLRTDSPRASDAAPDADRDAKIEQLLLAGLDHYFAARYEQAINVWTRALFFDRNHARAHAYIERARTALAEQQRETDELLHSGLAAFERGEGVEARRLLQTALGRGAPPDEALAVLDRLDRLEHGSSRAAESDVVHVTRQRAAARERRQSKPFAGRVFLVAASFAAVAAAAYAGFAWRHPASRPLAATGVLDILGLIERAAQPAALSPEPTEGGLSLPRRGEFALSRAQSLQASGHLHDALVALDAVRLTDKERPDADRLRAEIQRQLIAISSRASSGPIP